MLETMSEKSKIQKIIQDYPKLYVKKIKQDPELYEWVKQNTKISSEKFAEEIYSSLHSETNICEFGRKKKFHSIAKGFVGCAKADICICAKNKISESVSKTVSDFDEEKKKLIAKRRQETTFKKYGVTNNAQTNLAKQKHKSFYENNEKVTELTKKIQKTKLDRYGDKNYNNPVKIKNTWKERATEIWSSIYDDKDLEALHDTDNLKMLYETLPINEIAKKLNVHIQTVYKYLNRFDIKEPFQSSYEKEIVQYLKKNGIANIVQNSRKILPSGKELDIFLPDNNIAIEFNGIYWHHDDIPHITRSYHKDKFFECEQNGIQLITIFSNFWNNKKDIVKKTIQNKLGINSESIYARKTKKVFLKSKDTKEFLDKNHIQGYTPASLCYGLVDTDGELVAVMTFSKSRIAIGKKAEGFELVRYATSKRVVGGASRLLSMFRSEHPNETIFSYSNNEWSRGDLYKRLGFRLDHEIPPSYWYIHPKEEKLVHRFNFSKQKLIKMGYDPNMSEKEITRSIGLLKVWDCGKRRWVMEP